MRMSGFIKKLEHIIKTEDAGSSNQNENCRNLNLLC